MRFGGRSFALATLWIVEPHKRMGRGGEERGIVLPLFLMGNSRFIGNVEIEVRECRKSYDKIVELKK